MTGEMVIPSRPMALDGWRLFKMSKLYVSDKYIRINKTWVDFKLMCARKSLSIQYEYNDQLLTVFGIDNQIIYVCLIWVNGPNAENDAANLSDFETNYKNSSNRPLSPHTSDGKPISVINIFPGNTYPAFIGRSDDIENNVRYGGSFLRIQSTVEETIVREYQFLNYHYIGGAEARYDNAVFGDYIDHKIYAPSSAPAASNNPGAGSFNKVAVDTDKYMFVPAQNGDWDLDLVSKIGSSNINQVTPVPAFDANGNPVGYFDLDKDTNIISVNTDGSGCYYLFDHDRTLTRYAAYISIIGSGREPFLFPNLKSKKCLPHWKHKASVHNSSSKTLTVTWKFFISDINPPKN